MLLEMESSKDHPRRFSSLAKRIISKRGDCNVHQGNVSKRFWRYMQDIFTTLVDARWRWTLLVFVMSFILTWTLFGFAWWLIAYSHGNIQYAQNLKAGIEMNETVIPCVTEIRGYQTALLFSIETQHTIGYGNRFTTNECPEAIVVICLQCVVSVLIQAFMVGTVFYKLARPMKRAQTLLFSRNAVICHRDGVPCLLFRVGDMRKSHIIEAHIRAQIIRKITTKDGDVIPFYQQELVISAEGGQDRLMFIWPTIIVHKIDQHSPLYTLSAQDMQINGFEIVVMLEGIAESTSRKTQARSSYLPFEILWGHRFEHMIRYSKQTGEYEVDYTLFHNTYEVETPLYSSKQLDEIRAKFRSPNSLGMLPGISIASLDPPSYEDAASLGRS